MPPLSGPRSANRNSLIIIKSFTHLKIICRNIEVQLLLKYIQEGVSDFA